MGFLDDLVKGAETYVTGGLNYVADGLGDVRDEITGKNASDAALEAQTRGASEASQIQKDIYEQQREDLAPWREVGTRALAGLEANDFMDDWQQDPGYQFRMDEGLKAINAGASARGNLHSGATMKGLTRFGQDYASQEYGNVYNRESNRLSGLAGLGTNANQNMVNITGQYGQNQANTATGLANAQAGNIMQRHQGQNQLIGQGIQGAAMYFSDKRLKKNIVPISKEDLKEMGSKLKAYFFDYKSSEHGQGKWVGVMAQDLEKSKLGRTLVSHDENGFKQIDMKKVMSLFLATLAEV